MAYEVPGFVFSYKSSGDISQFQAVVISSEGVVAVSAEDTIIDGIAQMPAAAATPEVIRVMKSGISFAIAGGTVVAGDKLATDATGKLVAADYTYDNIVGTAMSGGVSGEEIAVLLV
jgi:hypothetical protein